MALKVEGLNPTGSFKDRGMTMAISVAVERGAKVVICASTGNTSASAAAYAARAGLLCAVVIPQGQIALGKLAQALIHGARVVPVHGTFDHALEIVRELGERPGVEVVNSVNPVRIEGQKTAAFEIVDVLGDAPTVHCIPVGNAGNITAYWRGYSEYAALGHSTRKPRMLGWQAAGAAPIVRGEPVLHPETLATAIQIGNPASWQGAVDARDQSGGHIGEVTDAQIVEAYRMLAADVGCFVEPASAASVAGLLQASKDGLVSSDDVVVCTVTGHGLKDPQRAIAEVQVGDPVDASAATVAAALDLVVSRDTALVTGASAGIGRAFAHGLAVRGYDLVLVARDGARLTALAEELDRDHAVTAEVLPADLLTGDGLAAVDARLRATDRPIGLLVNNAGFGTFGRFAELDVDREVEEIELNVVALVRLTSAALATMEARGRGAILNVASLAAYQPAPASATYGATKAFVHSFTHAVHEETRGSGVQVLLVCPGYTHTEFHERAELGATALPEFVWQSADTVVDAAMRDLARGRSVSIPGALNQVAAALSSVAPAGVTRRVAGAVVKRSG